MNKKQAEEMLQDACDRGYDDPYGFALDMWDWGKGELSEWEGPDWWHREVMEYIGAWRKTDMALPCRVAVCTGHGTGKTALMAMLIHWFASTTRKPAATITANTETQLGARTWRELAKWQQMASNGHWFEWTATQYYLKAHPATWKVSAVPWSLNNSQAFAGMHEQTGTMLGFDEASDIADKIWEVGDGALTTPGSLWIAFGNGTRNTGRFYECFNANRRFWKTWNIDSRTCKASTIKGPQYLEQLIEQYGGEETDTTKIRVRGLFPSSATRQLISSEAVAKCQKHEAEGWQGLPKLMGVDIARFGENSSAICLRQGRKVFPLQVLPKMDLMSTAHHVAEVIRAERPLQVFVDGSGIGAGVVDRLRQLNFNVVDVNGGNSSLNPRFLNKRAEMWWEMKEFIEGGCELPPDEGGEPTLKAELTCVEYDFTDKGRIRLDRKVDVMDEHGFSPDKADALAMTFAYPVADYSVGETELEPKTHQD